MTSIPPRGLLRVAVEDFGFTGQLDPVSENSPLGLSLFSQLLVRTLVTYRHVAGREGAEIVPDLATDTGRLSDAGRTWTFTLKRGVRFGPPLGRPILSSDIEYAFRRLMLRRLAPQYLFLYQRVITGIDRRLQRLPTDVAGIDTPDSRTIVFHLSAPVGDFPARLALPAAAPVPPEIAHCFTSAGGYGRDVVSSGPYMLAGADLVDRTPCKRLSPMSGFDPTSRLVLVRNPDYDPATDSDSVRENWLNGIDIRIERNTEEIASEIRRGEIDATLGTIPIAEPFVEDQRGMTLHWNALNALEYLSMNVLTPPFDDLHVRRAVNLALDRSALLEVFDRSGRGPPATHLFPPSILPVQAPSPELSLGGDLAGARQEMALSAYDRDGDGRCDSEACEKVLYVTRTTPPEINTLPLLTQQLSEIGIHLFFRELDCVCPGPFYDEPRNLIPIALLRPPQPLYPDPGVIARSLSSAGIQCDRQINVSEVGMTESQAKRCRVDEEWASARDHLPSLDERIEACERLSDAERASCWARFDAHVMEDVVPWAPVRWPDTVVVTGPRVIKYQFDQAFGTISLCHIKLRDS